MNDIQYTYILIGLLILSFVFNPFFKKKATGKLNSHEFLIVNHTLITILIILYGIYLMYYNKCDITCFNEYVNINPFDVSIVNEFEFMFEQVK